MRSNVSLAKLVDLRCVASFLNYTFYKNITKKTGAANAQKPCYNRATTLPDVAMDYPKCRYLGNRAYKQEGRAPQLRRLRVPIFSARFSGSDDCTPA